MPLEDIRQERIKKLGKLQDSGIDSYPAKTSRTHLVGEVLQKFSALVKNKKKVKLAGRLMAKREHGGSAFFDLKDETGKIQLFFKKDVLGDDYEKAIEVLDIGDFLQAEGKTFKTKRGESTIEVSGWTMLAKSLRPLPEKWHGLQDVEERFRKRYLDLLMNDEVKKRLVLRSMIIQKIRAFFEKNGFLEVETPLLHSIPGGALAKPFLTHHNALDFDFYLRIAPELYLKRLLVAGFEKIYEIGKNFRNEGVDHSHNPEFTMLECYAAFWDEEKMMGLVEDIMLGLAKLFGKKGEIEFEGQKILFKKPFPKITFDEILKKYALISEYEKETPSSMALRAERLGVDAGIGESKGKIADEIYKKVCRPRLIEPTFVVDHPIDISPLAKSKEGGRVRRFQLIAGGLEITNAFAELNDPLEQRKRLEEQEKMRSGGEEEAHRLDEDFLEALEYGMPPAAGLGIGIDRLVMLLTNTRNIKEVVLFPTLKPK